MTAVWICSSLAAEVESMAYHSMSIELPFCKDSTKSREDAFSATVIDMVGEFQLPCRVARRASI